MLILINLLIDRLLQWVTNNVNLSSVCICCIGEQAKQLSLNQGGWPTVYSAKYSYPI